MNKKTALNKGIIVDVTARPEVGSPKVESASY